MKSGGRRSPFGPLLGGLAVCVLMVAVLSTMLGAVATRSPAGEPAKITTISHATASAQLVARPATPEQHATPVVTALLVVAFGFVMVRHHRPVPRVALDGRRPTGRAPPGPITHR